MSHDRGCWKCGRDQWEYDRCEIPDCAKASLYEEQPAVAQAQPKVYVVQQQLHKDAAGVLVPKFDLSPAAKFGELVFVLKTDALPTDPNTLDRLHLGLKGITPQDFILPIGSTVLMVLAGIVAAEYVDRVNFLYWHGKMREYRVTSFDL